MATPEPFYFASFSKMSLRRIRLKIFILSKDTWSNSPPVFVGVSMISLIKIFLEGLFGSEFPAFLFNIPVLYRKINPIAIAKPKINELMRHHMTQG